MFWWLTGQQHESIRKASPRGIGEEVRATGRSVNNYEISAYLCWGTFRGGDSGIKRTSGLEEGHSRMEETEQ